jgi:2-methylaconitate cis-trans-isomerase PrpF
MVCWGRLRRGVIPEAPTTTVTSWGKSYAFKAADEADHSGDFTDMINIDLLIRRMIMVVLQDVMMWIRRTGTGQASDLRDPVEMQLSRAVRESQAKTNVSMGANRFVVRL